MSHDDHKALKQAMRSEIRQRLKSLSADELRYASVLACERLTNLPVVREANVVMLYMPLPGEVDVTPAIVHCLEMGKRVCVPEVNWEQRDMTPVELTSIDEASMQETRHGLRVPAGAKPIAAELVDVVVVPGLAFDANGHRLGRGGGFYDRFLARMHEGAAKVAIAFDAQIIDRPPGVPMSVTDVSVDTVVTDQRVIERNV